MEYRRGRIAQEYRRWGRKTYKEALVNVEIISRHSPARRGGPLVYAELRGAASSSPHPRPARPPRLRLRVKDRAQMPKCAPRARTHRTGKFFRINGHKVNNMLDSVISIPISSWERMAFAARCYSKGRIDRAGKDLVSPERFLQTVQFGRNRRLS